MKGIIITCLMSLVTEKFGRTKWEEALKSAGLDEKTQFHPTDDIDDPVVLKVVSSVCKVLNITPVQAADAFGDYWVNVFALRTFPMFYKGKKTARDFLLTMDYVHKITPQGLKDSSPPRFGYEWKNDKTLIMEYKSKRGLIDFMVGLVKGVGRYYNEQLSVTKVGNDKVQIEFS
jgi:hypothetical protein